MKYARQASVPEWYGSDESKLYESATSGSSPSNEWYGFDDRADAIAYIGLAFGSQSFLDDFCPHTDGEIYAYDQFTPESVANAFAQDEYILVEQSEPANLAEMIWAESSF
jgi:hypothetical protein